MARSPPSRFFSSQEATMPSSPLFSILLVFLSIPVSGIRDMVLRQKFCRNTVQGRHLIADDNVMIRFERRMCEKVPEKEVLLRREYVWVGYIYACFFGKRKVYSGYVCTALTVGSHSRCCPESGEQFSCQGCNLVFQCCDSYEYCVSCCQNPKRTVKELAVKMKIAKPLTAGTYASVFDFCVGRCRHSSASVVHENAYASDFHHCFSMQLNSSGIPEMNSQISWAGVDVVTGSLGESCNSVCNAKGKSCVPNKLSILNKCDILQKYMTCKGTCLASTGADQPAEVAENAPKDLNPGACLYTKDERLLSCEGSHKHTRRLCPCA